MVSKREGRKEYKGVRKNFQGLLLTKSSMKIRMIFWDVRGANNFEKRKVIKVFLKSQRAGVVCL